MYNKLPTVTLYSASYLGCEVFSCKDIYKSKQKLMISKSIIVYNYYNQWAYCNMTAIAVVA